MGLMVRRSCGSPSSAFIAILVDAVVFITPKEVGDRRTGLCIVSVVAWSTVAKVRVLRQLHHDGSHHFIVFVSQDVAMVNVPGKLSQLIVRNVEVSTSFFILISELRFGPSDAIVKSFEGFHEGSIFPALVIRLPRSMPTIFDIYKLASEVNILIKRITQVSIDMKKTIES